MKLQKFFEELFSFVSLRPEVKANELTAFQAALIRLKAHMKSSLLAASLFPLKILFFYHSVPLFHVRYTNGTKECLQMGNFR